MQVAVTGSSGLIGSALTPALEERGHKVLRLVRRPASGAGEASWDPTGGLADPARLENLDAVVHLAGVGIAALQGSKSPEECMNANLCASCHSYGGCALPEKQETRREVQQ